MILSFSTSLKVCHLVKFKVMFGKKNTGGYLWNIGSVSFDGKSYHISPNKRALPISGSPSRIFLNHDNLMNLR